MSKDIIQLLLDSWAPLAGVVGGVGAFFKIQAKIADLVFETNLLRTEMKVLSEANAALKEKLIAYDDNMSRFWVTHWKDQVSRLERIESKVIRLAGRDFH